VQMNPWTSEAIDDYSKLIEDFGISKIEGVWEDIPNPHPLMRRGVVFGHRDYGFIVDAMNSNEPFAAMSGFVPSGKPHFGHKMVMDQIIWHQKRGGSAFACVADMEARSARDVPLEKGEEIGREYLVSLIALGLEYENSCVYYQSKEDEVRNLAFELSNNVNLSELKAIYGFDEDTSLGHMYSTPVQSADILYPQLEKFGGPKPVVVPAGTDQDPHMRLVRDISKRARLFKIEEGKNHYKIRSRRNEEHTLPRLAQALEDYGEIKRYKEHLEVFYKNEKIEIMNKIREIEVKLGGYGFYEPSSTYHRFMTGLTGGKMSSSVEGSYIGLMEDPSEAAEKIKKAKTGGRTTLSEQKEKGGIPEKCSVYELLYFHFIYDDEEIEKIYDSCKDGRRMCGECKNETIDLLKEFLYSHQSKRQKAREVVDEYLTSN